MSPCLNYSFTRRLTPTGSLFQRAKLVRMAMGHSLRDIGKMLATTAASDALMDLSRGNVQVAYKAAVQALQLPLREEERRQLGKVFYANGKLLTSEGRFDRATEDFAKAVYYNNQNETFRRRHQAAVRALEQSSFRLISQDSEGFADANQIRRRLDVVSFCYDMCTKRNVSLSNLPPAAVLHYVRKARYLYPPRVNLPKAAQIDEFLALGTYRWQGDEKSGDQFSRWVRRLKDGNIIVSKHLGRLLADWLWSETDCLKNTDFLVTVPGEPQREARRGFNPPEALAKVVQGCLGVPLLLDVLSRNESSRARELTYQDVRRCFSLGKTAKQIEGQSVVLVDDVATRGYTLQACAEHLRDAGAQSVVCVVLAQSVTTHREQLRGA